MSDSNSDTTVSTPVRNKGKRKAVVLSDSMRESGSSSASEPDETIIVRNGKRKARIRESDSDSSIEKRKIKRIPRVASDSEGSSSDESEIIRTRKLSRVRVVLSDHDANSESDCSRSSNLSDVGFEDNSSTSDEWESDWVSDSEMAVAEPTQPQNTNLGNISDSSDGESEKCPICLLSFNQQEVGTPETCDHSFCAECIQEWSKNVNTCPVDRQTFTLILVRKRFNGKVIRRVPVDGRRPSEDELIHEDPTFCEICGMSDREDRLLLCDGCDLGYHLECLDPPMDTVPVEEWFCSICSGRTSQQQQQQHHRQHQQLQQHQQRHEPRLMPRTSQSERIRATIETNRSNNAANHDQQSMSSGFEDVSMPGTSNSMTRSRGGGAHTARAATRKKRKRRKRRAQYSVTYEICEATGEKIAIRTRRKTRRRARRRKRRTIRPRTVKKRLACQLGMCPPKSAGLAVPEVKVRANTSTTGHIGYQRTQAGIPALHLFGQRDSLDYFSGSDGEEGGGAGSARTLAQSRSLAGGMGALRRAARLKAAALAPHPSSPSVNSCDILGSILDSQAKLHSKHSKLSVTRDGTIRIENDRITQTIDLSSRNNELETRQAPMFPGRGGGNNRQPYGFNRGGGYRSNNENRYEGHPAGNYNNFGSGGRGRGANYGFGGNQRDNYSGGGNYMNFHHHGGPPPFRGRGPPRFPIRRPQYPHHHQHQNEAQHQFREADEVAAAAAAAAAAATASAPPVVELVLDDGNEQPDASRVQEQEDVDIYSDIEDNVQTQDEDEAQVKPPPPPPQPQGLVSQAYNNSDDDDSGSELIIDDTKDDKNDATPAPPEQEEEEEESVVSISAPVEKVEEAVESRQLEPFSQQVVKQVVQEVLQEHLNTPVKKANVEYDDDELSNDDCPNFSIYSSTSIDIAKATDFSVDIPSEKPEECAEVQEKHENATANDDATMEVDEKAKEGEWPSGDEWDTCDAENAQKSWDQPYEAPEQKVNTPPADKLEDQIDESIAENEGSKEGDKKEDNESDSDESIAKDAKSRSPTPDANIVSESLTPPLPQTTVPLPNQRAPAAAPIKIAFNPNARKLQKTRPFAEKEKVIQLYDDSDYEEWELKNEDKLLKPSEDQQQLSAVDADADADADANGELEKLTEAISEEERSYTPCLDEKDPTKLQYSEDEKNTGAGIGGMDTEMISDDERNEFDESHDMKTISDGDALEINAKESELELARPEDYEEGEIVEKAAAKQAESSSSQAEAQPEKSAKANASEDEKKKRPKKRPAEKEPEKEKQAEGEKSVKKSEFKKISKSNKERNYRDKERSKSKELARGKENRENNSKEEMRKKKERKRDLERYNVRSIIADKPKKDQFGRDIKSPSRSSRSLTPRRSRSHSWTRAKKRRRRSRSPRRSRSRSRSHTPRSRSRGRTPRRSRSFRRPSKSPRRSRSRSFRRSRTPKNKRHREVKSLSRERDRVRYRNRSRRSADRTQRKKKNRSPSRNRVRTRSPSPSPAKHRVRNEWPRQGEAYTREWTPSWSRSPTPPRPIPRHNLPQSMSPSWTPPIAIDKGPVQPENLTVILNNDVNKSKKKEKRKKADKKSRDEFRKRKRADRTPPPSKEVFASGDNILVSVSFNKTTNEESTVQREVMGVKRKRDSVSDSSKKKKKEKDGEKKKKRAKSPRTKKKNKEIANLKPVAIIDLDRSPFKELTPSPKDIIVLSDSDNCEKEDEALMVHHHEMLQEELMALGAQNQEDSAPQSPSNNYLSSTGPKTPPEPQIKFLLTSKQSQLRAINNPLHDPNDEADAEIDPQEELEHRLDDILHKGPNTPPEPPTSPPSSPDAYDPFDPTKSRSPTPEPPQNQPVLSTPGDTKESESDLVDLAVGPLESSQKSTCSLNDSLDKQIGSQTPEGPPQTRTPPIVGSEQTSDTNENKNDTTERSSKSPERNPIGVIINQQVQLPAVVKPIIATSSVMTSTASIISSTSLPRANLFNTCAPAVGGAPRIATSVPQRIILPTPSKASPAKTSPSKQPPIKSTPIKPMPSKTMISKLPVPNMKPMTPIRKGAPAKPPNRAVGQNGNEIIDVDLDFDSPYSPGSSDYEDLFEPPAETVKTSARQKNTKSPAKQNPFDNLFGSSPVFRNNKTNNTSSSKANKTGAAKVPVKMNKKTANPKANSKTVGVKIDEDNLKILDDLPNSAVEMQVKDKFLKKLNRQERVVEEVKLVLKPHYNKKHVTKEQYKDILRRAVPKICHNRSGEINPKKIQNLIEAYVKKARHGRKTANPANQGANAIAQQPKPYREIRLKRNYFI